MLRLLSARFNVSTCGVSEVAIPNEILRAVQASPVPVGAHHGADEVGVILVRSRVVVKSAGSDGESRCGDCKGTYESH